MAGYAIQVHIISVRPRRVQSPVDRPRAVDRGTADPQRRSAAVDSDAVVIESVPTRPRSERMERIREVWSQLTFYLFDADGWR